MQQLLLPSKFINIYFKYAIYIWFFFTLLIYCISLFETGDVFPYHVLLFSNVTVNYFHNENIIMYT